MARRPPRGPGTRGSGASTPPPEPAQASSWGGPGPLPRPPPATRPRPAGPPPGLHAATRCCSCRRRPEQPGHLVAQPRIGDGPDLLVRHDPVPADDERLRNAIYAEGHRGLRVGIGELRPSASQRPLERFRLLGAVLEWDPQEHHALILEPA